MAGTVTKNVLSARSGDFEPQVKGDPQKIMGTGFTINQITMSAAYVSDGDNFSLSDYYAHIVNFCVFFPNGSNFLAVYVPDGTSTPGGGKVKLYDMSTNAEAANGDYHTQTYTFIAGGV